MKTPAIIASLTIVGSLAFAAGNESVTSPGERNPDQRSDARTRESPRISTTTASDCPTGEPVVWFSPIPQLVPCSNGSAQLPFVTAQLGPVDVNDDGIIEFWGRLSGPFSSPDVVLNGSPTGIPSKIWVNRLDPLTRAPTTIRDSVVIVPSDFGNWVLANFPGTTSASVRLSDSEDPAGLVNTAGLRDMDGDGDLDYLIILYVESASSNALQQVWFENIGFEKPAPPIAADINGDGRVDGADLGMLLIAWGPTN
jgi:hypothetical protein